MDILRHEIMWLFYFTQKIWYGCFYAWKRKLREIDF